MKKSMSYDEMYARLTSPKLIDEIKKHIANDSSYVKVQDFLKRETPGDDVTRIKVWVQLKKDFGTHETNEYIPHQEVMAYNEALDHILTKTNLFLLHRYTGENDYPPARKIIIEQTNCSEEDCQKIWAVLKEQWCNESNPFYNTNEAKRKRGEEYEVVHDAASKPVVKCPYCGSTDVKKISTTSRVVSVSTFGLASKKIGKQFHCNKCKADF